MWSALVEIAAVPLFWVVYMWVFATSFDAAHAIVCVSPGLYGHRTCLQGLTCLGLMFVCVHGAFCRVHDYWRGYKLFCYAFYSQSGSHESEFKDSKLGSWFPSFVCYCSGSFSSCYFLSVSVLYACMLSMWRSRLHCSWGFPGQLVCRHLPRLPSPSRHEVRAKCMQLLPLVEMYCKWVLNEDCSSLRALMLRFDNERELEAHELGRSLLLMVRDDDDDGLDRMPSRVRSDAASNPFDAIRARLADADVALRGLHPQVHVVMGLHGTCNIRLNKIYGIAVGIESGLHEALNPPPSGAFPSFFARYVDNALAARPALPCGTNVFLHFPAIMCWPRKICLRILLLVSVCMSTNVCLARLCFVSYFFTSQHIRLPIGCFLS